MAPANEKKKFIDGEKVLCYHGPLLYEAKIVKTRTKDRVTKYLIHYAGWNVKWDEWAAESRVMKYNEEGLKKQKELKHHHSNAKKSKNKNAKDEKKDESTSTQSKKRKGRGVNAESEPSYVQKLDVKVIVPQDLRRYLLDDCDFVTRQRQLVPLPKPPGFSVKDITEKYLKYKVETTNDLKNYSSLVEVCNGLCEYFDVMIGSQLLYKFERTQYSDLLKEYPNKPLSELYGCEHFLRLCIMLGNVLSYSCLDESSMEFVVMHIHDFLDFMMRNSEDFFVAEYENSTPDYQRRCAF
uniref:Mortality factor 4-like protein 1 n=1 Tax=Hydra vulgaris TaxID=6087 RepID=T2M3C3_HYDVU